MEEESEAYWVAKNEKGGVVAYLKGMMDDAVAWGELKGAAVSIHPIKMINLDETVVAKIREMRGRMKILSKLSFFLIGWIVGALVFIKAYPQIAVIAEMVSQESEINLSNLFLQGLGVCFGLFLVSMILMALFKPRDVSRDFMR